MKYNKTPMTISLMIKANHFSLKGVSTSWVSQNNFSIYCNLKDSTLPRTNLTWTGQQVYTACIIGVLIIACLVFLPVWFAYFQPETSFLFICTAILTSVISKEFFLWIFQGLSNHYLVNDPISAFPNFQLWDSLVLKFTLLKPLIQVRN